VVGELPELKPDTEKIKDILKDEMGAFMLAMQSPETVDQVFRNPSKLKRFQQLFGTQFRTKLCTRKQCGRIYLYVGKKGPKFCCPECERIYLKKPAKTELADGTQAE
jgi:hypothetical protein